MIRKAMTNAKQTSQQQPSALSTQGLPQAGIAAVAIRRNVRIPVL